jgi:hypothetical protein
MKSRLWPSLLFLTALGSLPLCSGCTIQEHVAEPPCPVPEPLYDTDDVFADNRTVAAGFCILAYCDSLDAPETAGLLAECQAGVMTHLAGSRPFTWECVSQMFVMSNECPDYREVPDICTPKEV